MNEESTQYDRVCKGEFGELHAKLDRMDEAIRGNGEPGGMVLADSGLCGSLDACGSTVVLPYQGRTWSMLPATAPGSMVASGVKIGRAHV